MEPIDFTQLTWDELKKLGFVRWGRQPIPNLWLMPAPLFLRALRGQLLYGIDGKPYAAGIEHIDQTALYGYLAYGVKVAADTEGGLPEIDPRQVFEQLVGSSLQNERRVAQQVKKAVTKGRGTFFGSNI